MRTPSSPNAITLSVIIVSWNVRDLLRTCLQSLFDSCRTVPLEVFVVDNNSRDGTAAMVRERFPSVRVIANQENLGFSRANNQGIRLAQGRYILLLNPDTRWTDDSVTRLVEFMEVRPECGAVGPKLLDADEKTVQFEGARRFPSPFDIFCEYTRLSMVFQRSCWSRRYLMAEWDHNDSRRVECLSGSCLLVRREVFEDVGELDEAYLFNVEDLDWCYRVSRSRWQLHYLAETRVVHLGRQSVMNNRGFAALGAMRGLYRYYRKFHGNGTALLAWALLWPVSVVKLAIWLGVYVVQPSRRDLAREQASTFWKICRLFPRSVSTGGA